MVASKLLVNSDGEAGVEILIRPADYEATTHCAGERVLEFEVPEAEVRDVGLVEAVKRRVATANRAALRLSSSSRIALSLVFSDAQRPLNLLSEDLLEKTIDAVGAAPVAERRLFDETPGRFRARIHNTDDSVVFGLLARKTDTLPPGVFIRGEIWSAFQGHGPLSMLQIAQTRGVSC